MVNKKRNNSEKVVFDILFWSLEIEDTDHLFPFYKHSLLVLRVKYNQQKLQAFFDSLTSI